jgi:hypothetical protein
MKKQTLYSIVAAVLILSLGSAAASAQRGSVFTFQVPFEFQAQGKTLPAGKYTVRRDPMTPGLLRIQNYDQNLWLSVYTVPHRLSEDPAETCLVFKGYGEKRFLTEVKVLGLGDGYELIKTKAQRREEQIAKAKTTHMIPESATK